MIIVSMVLHGAVSRTRKTLVTITIWNDGTGTATRGNYNWTIQGRNDQMLKKGHLPNWPRAARTACALLQAVINQAYPSK